MMKISTRLFAASALAAMLICVNEGAFAAEKTKKVAVKSDVAAAVKPSVKLVGSAKIAPKAAVKTVALKSVAGTAKVASEKCPMCAEKEAAKAKG